MKLIEMLFPIVFFGGFFLIIVGVGGFFIFKAIKGLIQWHKNNQSPVITVVATVAKLEMIMAGIAPKTEYYFYATFELKNGEVIKFDLSRKQHNALIEGKEGKLCYQGTRYKGFEAERWADGRAVKNEKWTN